MDTFNQRQLASDALAFLRKESVDLFNRLHSIAEDILFVNQVHEFYPQIPVIPNLRCGAWYTDPALATDCPAYFKSTDGHFNNWSFNLRRPNLQLLSLVAAQTDGTGIILVDSSRGKRVPDSLSKSVPIWCAVINRAVKEVHSQGKEEWDTNFYTHPAAVSNQEHHQIQQRLDAWASALANSSYDLPNLRFPLRPMWITPSSSSFPRLARDRRTFVPIICLSASRQVQDGVERRSGGFAYVQGSGDDHELWGMGLTPNLFWHHRTTLLDAERAELPTLVESLVTANAKTTTARSAVTPIKKVGGFVLVCANSDLREMLEQDVAHIIVGANLPPVDSGQTVLKIQTWEGKKGQFQFLQDVLPRSIEFIRSHLGNGRRVCVSCDSGTDTSVGIALATLAKFFDDAGDLVPQGDNMNKNSIRMRLEWIIDSRPLANPSRTTLKRVNEYLLSSSSFRAPPSKPFPSTLQPQPH